MDSPVKRAVLSFLKDKIIFGTDPGESTGLVQIFKGVKYKCTLDQVDWFRFCRDQIEIGPHNGFIWVVESYLEYHSHRGGNVFKKSIPSEIIGTIKLMQYMYGFHLVEQTANHAKQVCPDELLSQIFDLKRFSRHEKDALRHIVAYALSQIGGKITKKVQ